MSTTKNNNTTKSNLEKEALDYHKKGRPGKLEITPTTPLISSHDLSLAYSPGVATPCLEIEKNPDTIYDYTSKGNVVAVISNGTAVLGLGNIGAGASKPVMEGKAVLFKKFADVDGIDLEVDTDDIDRFVDAVSLLGSSFGGINLEDIKAPDCFIIEQRLREMMDIPVFHDDQHGTAIVTAAGIINALHLTNRNIKDTTFVSNGAGAASIACVELLKAMGAQNKNVILVDRDGVIYKGRQSNMNQWKSGHTVDTKARTLEDALRGADVFLGLSVPGSVTKDMVKSMASKPIIFAMANPIPEIMPEDVKDVRSDAIIATGRSDYPNQVNNVLGFPYIFRGAMDVRSKTINEEMKVSAAKAIAKLAREDVPDEVVAAMGGERPHYGKDYIIPSTFDPRLISVIPSAVAKAAMDSGVARKPIKDFELYKDQLKQRLDPTVTIMQGINSYIKKNQKRIVFADGEDENTLKAAIAFKNSKLGIPILIGKEEKVKEQIKKIGYDENFDIEIINSKDTLKREKYVQYLFKKLQREQGLLEWDCDRLVRNDRVVWASCMVACGDADGAVTGNTRRFGASLEKIKQVVNPRPGEIMFGLNLVVSKGKTIFVADTSVHEYPTSEEMSEIAISTARVVRLFGFDPKVAFVSHSTFGQPVTSRTKHIKRAVEILKDKNVDFEFDGDMQPDVALDEEYKSLYPFSKIVGSANILIMPGQHSAAISYKMMKTLGDIKVIGPLLIGLGLPIEIAPLRTSTSELINLASIAAYSADIIDYKK